MGTISTFGTYSLARLGIYAAQNSISITGNNISNVNTLGYTRQAPDQISMHSGGADRYQSTTNLKLGNGSLVKSVMQLRDQYLDLRYRDAQADVGAVDATLAIQQQLAAILDEVGNGPEESGVLEAYFSAMEEQLQNMITQGVGDDRYETLFRSAAATMVRQLHDYAAQLEDLENKTAEEFQMDVDKVNDILNNIRELNVQIRKSQIFGSNPLELLDARNNLIDELSYYMDVRVSIEAEDIGNDEYVDRLVIRTVPADGSEEEILIYGTYGAQLSVLNEDEYEGAYALAVSKLKNIIGAVCNFGTTTETKTLTPNDIAEIVGKFQQPGAPEDAVFTLVSDGAGGYTLSWENDDGTSGGPVSLSYADVEAALKDYYPETVTANGKTSVYEYTFEQDATTGEITMTTEGSHKSAAYIFNDTELFGALQSEREMLTESGNYWLSLDDTKENEAYLKADPNGDTKRGIPYYRKMLDLFANSFAQMMNDANDAVGGGVLFSNNGTNDDPTNITARNISISKSWANGSVYIVHGEVVDGELSTDSTNLLKILGILQNEDLEFKVHNAATGADETFFKGSFQQLFTNHTVGNLATDISMNTTRLQNYEAVRDEVYTERDGVSGVYLDDEAMNMMQYQQAYNAACRLMTTFDEMIDKLVNGM